jgi:four helix bundle protein
LDFDMAKKLDDLLIYQKFKALDVAISAILQRPCWRRFRKLHGQLSASVESVGANIEEGFEQPTDRGFAHFLSISKGSAAETAGHLRRGARRGCVTRDEARTWGGVAEEIVRMEASLIRHLHRSDYKDRGRFKESQAGDEEPPTPA